MRNSGSKSKNVSLNQIAIIFSVDLDEADFCKTCSDHIRKRNVPNLAASYGFRYPEQPYCLSELNDLEERLVALRIPFMQIRELGRDRQYGIKGSVTNIPNDLHKSVDCLPRKINDSATIYVKLKKRLYFKSHFMYQCVNPNRVYCVALYLMNKPIYQSQNVNIDLEWLENFRTESFPEGSNACAEQNPISSEENDESHIGDNDYDDPFVIPLQPRRSVINSIPTLMLDWH
ncbi:ATP-dependent DNA helicase [Caerostris darwini]|uniref:ATP-dependent DNA helicase n=1 Tax=Caerostris darwini TaxID=1538125 RepID=A0AAV4WXA8_9ARAC|nr:ATP-dependent DNA helicase [Caerostris darwini]